MSRRASPQTITVMYNGFIFTKDKKSGYYLSAKPIGLNGNRIHLHRYVWEVENGAIPDGYVVHHIDENKDNNNIENLKLETIAYHSHHHSKERCDNNPQCKEEFIERTNDKAKAWHSSPEGIEWHKNHAKYSICKQQKMVTLVCQNCGKEYQTGENFVYRSKYCCRNCKASARRKRIKNESKIS